MVSSDNVDKEWLDGSSSTAPQEWQAQAQVCGAFDRRWRGLTCEQRATGAHAHGDEAVSSCHRDECAVDTRVRASEILVM